MQLCYYEAILYIILHYITLPKKNTTMLKVLFLIAFFISFTSGQPYVLSNFEAFYPRISGCVTNDTFIGPFINQTECGPRSDGCNFDTGQCILAEIFGYTLGNFLGITPDAIYSAQMPGVSDGAVNVSIAYLNATFTSPQGILQVWSLFETINGVDIFRFANREVYLKPTIPNSVQRFTFYDLPAGDYRVVFWDWGGTRFGNGFPETSVKFTIPNVFPIRLAFSLRFVEEYAANTTRGIRFPETMIKVANKHFMGYRLVAEGISETTLNNYLSNAEALHNRSPAWIWRSDMGNAITVTLSREQVCNQGYRYRAFGSAQVDNLACSVQRFVNGQSCSETMWSRQKIFPMNSGGYGVVSAGLLGPDAPFNVTRNGRKTVLEFRLNYANFLGTTNYDYWAHRQQYFYTTVVALKKIQSIQIDNTEGQTINSLRTGPAVAPFNHVRKTGPRDDLLVVYFVRYDKLQLPGKLFAESAVNYGLYTGLLQYGKESYGPYDLTWADRADGRKAYNYFFGSTGFPYFIHYTDHDNSIPDQDYSCFPLGTNYAESFFPGLSTLATFADTTFSGRENALEYNGNCQTATGFGDLNTNPCTGTINSLCELCCDMNTRPGGTGASGPDWINYPCFDYLDSAEVTKRFGNSYVMTHDKFLEWTLGARREQYNAQITQSGGGYINQQFSFDTSGGVSWSIFPTLKDMAAGTIPQVRGDGIQYEYFAETNGPKFLQQKFLPFFQSEDVTSNGPVGLAVSLPKTSLTFVIYNTTGNVKPVVTNNDGLVFGTAFGLENVFAVGKNPAIISIFDPDIGTAVNYNAKIRDDNDPLCAYPVFPDRDYDFITDYYATTGFDTTVATIRTSQDNIICDQFSGQGDCERFEDFEVAHDVQVSSVFARFQMYPRITFHNFQNAIFPRGSSPATIDVEFRVACPLMEMGYGSQPGYCAQAWFITNQANANIIVSVTQGTLETDAAAIAASGKPAGQVLGPVKTDAIFIVRVIYNNGDLLHWEFALKAEPEKPYGSPTNLCRYSTRDSPSKVPTYQYQFVPAPVEIEVPPQEYVLLPMIVNVASAQPACEYNPQEVRARVKRSQYYNFAVVNEAALSSISDTGQRSESQLYYYYDWKIGTAPNQARIQGFAESTQLYTPPMELTVYDHFFSVTTTQVTLLPVNPLYPNPLLRPARCAGETLANASCPVNLESDDPQFSGINQFQYCTSGPGPRINSVALTPRFIFIPPYTYTLNVGSCFFNFTFAYISPAIADQLFGGIFEDCRSIPFIVDQNNAPSGSAWISLVVRYGITIQALFNVPCWERFITNVIVLSSFQLTPLPVQYIDGCFRSDGCCYRQPFAVGANSPYTGQPIDLTNTSTPCFGEPFCAYEIVVSPPANNIGGLCLGVAYTFTVQSPAALVANRVGPYDASFPLPWRCPDSVTITLPFGGFSPPNIETIPGPCTRPGTVVRFDFTFTDVNCEGPVSAANDEPACRRDIYFAIQANNNSTAYNTLGAPSIANPFRLDGINTFPYNNEGSFLFPQRFSPLLPPVPNGIWNIYFWAVPSGAPPSVPTAVQNPGDVVSAQFFATLAGIDGIRINRLNYFRPPCPGPPIVLSFLIYDIAFNGPYNISFYTPGGALIDNQTIGFEYCVGFGVVPLQQLLIDCAAQIQSQGISIEARIPTGNISTGETGFYTLFVFAEGSECPAIYQEFVVSLETLRVQIECVNTTCPGSRNGNVNTEVTGGTPIPVINITTYLGSDFDIWRPEYYYFWNTPQGLLRTSDLLRVPAGFYELSVRDFNNCTVPVVSCTVGSLSPPMTLVPVSQTPPNCTGEFGQANFTVEGGVEPYILYKISNRSVVQTPTYSILADSTVLPDQNSTYVVIDSLGCVSPQVSFFLQGPVRFFLNLVIKAYPCDAFSATGTIEAQTPGGLGTNLVWTNLLTGQVISSANCLFGPSCLTVTDLPASTYRVVATSSIYGCTTEATIALTARPPPDIQLTREQDPNSAFLDRAFGSFFSSNGPPYTVSFFGIDFNVPLAQRPVFTQNPPSGNLVFWTLFNLPAQTTFQLTVTDAGGCLSTFTSLGRQITIIDNLATPTPFIDPSLGPTRPPIDERDPYNPNADMLFVIFAVLIPFAMASIFLIGYMIRRNRY